MTKPRLFLDLDGVFADFDAQVRVLLGGFPDELDDKKMWKGLTAIPQFYRQLPRMPGAKMMWEAFAHYGPTFLSGVPLPDGYMAHAPQDKTLWVAWNFGSAVPLITCPSKNKADFCNPGDVLLDDRDHYAHLWIAAGGVFIHHSPHEVPKSIKLVKEAMGGSTSNA